MQSRRHEEQVHDGDRSSQPEVLTMRMPANANDKALTFLRVSIGLLFLVFGQYKVFGTQFTLGGGFQQWIHRFLDDGAYPFMAPVRSEEHTSELQSRRDLVCRLLLEKKKIQNNENYQHIL